MSRSRTYLDYNATAPVPGAVRDAVCDALDLVGNPSSIHAEGRAARALVEGARHKVAALVGAGSQDLIFTGSGTEANNMVFVAGPDGAGDWDRVFVSSLEHASVLAPARSSAERTGRPCTVIPALSSGLIDINWLARELHALRDRDELKAGTLISVQAANNETGAVQPIVDVAAMAAEFAVRCHVDAVQAPGKTACDLARLGIDYLTLSGHKIGGPKGIGALIAKPGAKLRPLIAGGGQERRHRAGTENVAAIAGFGVAADLVVARPQELARLEGLRHRLESEVRRMTPTAVIIASEAERLANTSCIALPGRRAETLVIALDLAGIAVSAGSACSSGKVARSHVLDAMGLAPEIAEGAIRVSLGWRTSEADIDAFLGAWNAIAGEGIASREVA